MTMNTVPNTKPLYMVVDMQNDFLMPDGALTLNAPGLADKTNVFINSLDQGSYVLASTLDTHYKENYHETEEGKVFPLH
ncbi:MAG: hypothetical protein FWF01_02295, partial [Alphaproteobacteria bacterium]|nr:hypothetical protein [Alphaproteobacteria bacterium]